MNLSDSPVEVRASPLLGEHAGEILGEIMGYSKEQVDQLRAEGVVVDVTALDVMDSFATRTLRGIAEMTRLRASRGKGKVASAMAA